MNYTINRQCLHNSLAELMTRRKLEDDMLGWEGQCRAKLAGLFRLDSGQCMKP